MRKSILAAMLAVTAATPMLTAPAAAQRHDYRWHDDRNGWDPRGDYRPGRFRERRLGRDDRIYRGSDNRYYCRRNDGTTGLVIGAIGGALAGGAIGGSTLGTLLGAGGGALLGRSIDRGNVRCR